MSRHQNPAIQSRIDAAREGNGRFGSWISAEDASVTLSASVQRMTLQELEDLHLQSARAARAAQIAERMTGVAIAAQHVLGDYPHAETIILDWGSDGEIQAVRVQNAERETLGSYSMDDGGGPGWTATHEWLSYLETMNQDPEWKIYTPETEDSWEDRSRIHLAPAAAWSPEPAGDDLVA